jgi:hypothetical protein
MAKIEYAWVNGVELEYLLIRADILFADITGFIRSRETLRLWCNSTVSKPRRARAEKVRMLASLIAKKLCDSENDVFEAITIEQCEEWFRCECCGQPVKRKESLGKTESTAPNLIEANRLMTSGHSMAKSFACRTA